MDLPQSTPYDLAARLTARLDRPKWHHNQRAVACCPAHDDKNPSLVIDVKDDRLLLYCPAGCSNEEILSAIGLELRDLFVDWPVAEWQRRKMLIERGSVFVKARHELWILAQCWNSRLEGDTLETPDLERERLAAQRLKGYLEGIYDV